MLKIGDRVVISDVISDSTATEDFKDYRDSVINQVGTVTYVPNRENALYDVDFDEPIGNGFKSVRHHFYRSELRKV